jgi:arabinofuranosyltransferase
MTRSRDIQILGLITVVVFAVILFRGAWISDDAYITLRTVDNFVHGLGLRWNPAERVQTYTHPLWMFLLSLVFFFTREGYFTTLIPCLVFSLATVSLLAFKLTQSPVKMVLVMAALTFSKAFVDYSTSGLENPLTHLLLAVFLLRYFRSDTELDTQEFFWLSLLAALAVLNRQDIILIFLPALLYLAVRIRKRKVITMGLAAFTPIILWEVFSILYYGFPFPNTAYAKLDTGIRSSLVAEQGVIYLLNSLHWDPLTPAMIAIGVILGIISDEQKMKPMAVGVALYLAYVVVIGGDFMSGRFLAAPLLVALVLIVHSLKEVSPSYSLVLIGVVILLGFASPLPTVLSDANYGEGYDPTGDNGIADERGYYYEHTGLLRKLKGSRLPYIRWVDDGLRLRQGVEKVVLLPNIGIVGYYAGPDVHLIDTTALADPLMARLPVIDPIFWRIGHFDREVPEGYMETLESGENKIKNPNLALYYDKLALVVRGNIWDWNRLKEIWNLNTGRYDGLLEAYVKATGNQ